MTRLQNERIYQNRYIRPTHEIIIIVFIVLITRH